MNIVLFRHAKKGLTPFENPDLTPDGFAQAEAILKKVLDGILPAPTEIWVSEKVRTRQTLQAVANKFQILCHEKDALDQHKPNETQSEFYQRVKNLIEKISTQQTDQSCLYLCTHYDWIENAMNAIPSDTDLTTFHFSSWAPAQFVHFKIEPTGLWHLIKKGVAN